MDIFFSAFRPNTICLCSALIAVSMSAIPSAHAFELVQRQAGSNDIAFGFRIQKLVENIKRYKDKLDESKIIEAMGELKREIEGYTGRKINLDTELDRAEGELNRGGARLKQDEFKKVRARIKQADRRDGHRSAYMSDCLIYNLDYDAEFEQLTYLAEHGEDKREADVPLRLTVE